jgi:hypothetical protein
MARLNNSRKSCPEIKSVILSEGGALAAVVEGPAVAFVVACPFVSDLSSRDHI